jgi:hypothetical protein
VQRYKILYENVHIKFKCNLYILLLITYEYLSDEYHLQRKTYLLYCNSFTTEFLYLFSALISILLIFQLYIYN